MKDTRFQLVLDDIDAAILDRNLNGINVDESRPRIIDGSVGCLGLMFNDTWSRHESRLARDADYDAYRDHSREDDAGEAARDERRERGQW